MRPRTVEPLDLEGEVLVVDLAVVRAGVARMTKIPRIVSSWRLGAATVGAAAARPPGMSCDPATADPISFRLSRRV